MAREVRLDAVSIVERELVRLGRANMSIVDFREQAELSDAEKDAVNALFHRKNPITYVDGVNYYPPVAMVGTFEGGE
jgi:hypothetical protein